MFFTLSSTAEEFHAGSIEISCPNCHHDTLEVILKNKVSRACFIPVWERQKVSKLVCPSCGHIHSPKPFIRTGQLNPAELPTHSKSRWGVLLIVGFVIFAFSLLYLDDQQDAQSVSSFIEAPVPNAILVLKTQDPALKLRDAHSLFFVQQTTEDGIFVQPGQYVYSGKSQAKSAAKELLEDPSSYFKDAELYFIPNESLSEYQIVSTL